FNNAAEQLANRKAARPRHKCALHAVSLCAPFILNRERPIDRVEPGIVFGMAVEKARQHTVECSDGNCIVESGAAIRGAELQGWIFHRRPDPPPYVACIP